MNQTSPNLPPDISRLSFEEALVELEQLVRKLEDGKAKLDDAISAYERGALLKRHCEAKLREAQSRIEKIAVAPDGSAVINKDGSVTAAPFNA